MGDWLYPSLRFAHYALLLGLFGITAFRSIGLRQALPKEFGPQPMKRLAGAAAAATLLTVAVMLASIGVMMAQTVWQLEWATIEAMVTTTSIGWALLVRLGLLLAACATLILFGRRPYAVPVAALLFGLALATLAWSGHAAATEGVLGTLHRLNDAAHLLAAGLWIGAIGWFVYLTRLAHTRPDVIAPAPLLFDMHRFAPLGAVLVALVGLTGLANAQLIFGLDNSVAVLGTSYGWLLAAKICLVGLMLLCAARNAILGQRYSRMRSSHPATTIAILAQLRISLVAEVTLGLAVVGLMALIGTMSPMGD